MAVLYVNSVAGSNTAPYDTWAKGATAFATAVAAAAAGDDIVVASDHSDTPGSTQTWTFPGTLSSPNRVYSANRAGSAPPVSADLTAGGIIGTTGNFGITISGCAYIYGLTVKLGSGAVSPSLILGGTSQTDLYFDGCAINLVATTAPVVTMGSISNNIGARIVWNNTTYQIGNAASTLQFQHGVYFMWKNTANAIAGATFPTNLIGTVGANGGTVVLDGVDLNALGSKTLCAAQSKNLIVQLKDCKIPGTFTINAAPTSASPQIFVTHSSSSGNAYKMEKHDARGDQTTETTIVRTGGATVDGQAVAMKIVGTANAKFQAPFESTPLVVQNNTTAANVTVTVYGIWSGGAVPNNDEVWMEIGYFGSSATPQLTFNNATRKADILATGAGQSTDSSTWGGSTTAFKLTTTLSSPQPALAGKMYIVIKQASTNTTYIDPLPVLS